MLCLKDALIKDSVLHMVKQIAVTDYLHAEWDIAKIIKPSSKWIHLEKKKPQVWFRCHCDLKSRRFFLRYLLGRHGNSGTKGFPASLCPSSYSLSRSAQDLDWSFGNCMVCLGCLAVAPICSDNMHTELCWLSGTNLLVHYLSSGDILAIWWSGFTLFLVCGEYV